MQIIEVSPRDGLQNEAVLLSTEQKVALIRRAAAAGARRIEAVSFVNPKAVPQMADAEAVIAATACDPELRALGVSLIGLALNRRGVDRAIQCGVDEINFVVVASETFNRRNQGVEISETLAQLASSAAIARSEGLPVSVTIGATFGCPFEGEVAPERVAEIAGRVADMGVSEIALADTIGVADPLTVEDRIRRVAQAAPGVALRCHFHNTRNTGLANAFAAWRAGVERLDASIGGIGGCPFAPTATGNIPTEDTAYMFERMGVSTGYDLSALSEAARWIGGLLSREPPGMLSRAGLFPPRPAAQS